MECSSPCKDDFYSYYTSEPTSPRKCNHKDGFFFLSMPTSPTRDPPGFNSRSITPVETPGKFSLYVENFEFEGSKRFYGYDENESQKSQDLSMMAYADELFCDGRMLPLRLPPRSRADKRRGDDSSVSSPGGRSSVLKVPFLKQKSLWNDGYDPFLAALNKIKEENEGVVGPHDENKAHLRRSKSLSLYRKPNGPDKWNTHKHQHMGLSPQKEISSPVKRDYFRPIQEPIEENSKSKSLLESRKQRIKKFLLQNASFGKEVNEKQREYKPPLLLRKMRNSKRLSGTNSNAIIRISREMKSLMKHRARIFFRLAKGFGIRGTTKMS